jgi:hypothetical protein
MLRLLPYSLMEEIKPKTFRPLRVLLASLVLTGLALLIAPPLYHTAMIWLNDGTWCVKVKADGTTLIRYGAEACGM